MSEAYVIEVGDQTAGIVVREQGERQFSFHAAKQLFALFEGLMFSTPREAERFVRRHLGKRRRNGESR